MVSVTTQTSRMVICEHYGQGRTHGGGASMGTRGARPPWNLKNTIFSGFVPLNYAIRVFKVQGVRKKDTHHFVSFFKARASIFSKLAMLVD